MYDEIKLYRRYGYDVLINVFECEFKQFLINEIFLLNFPTDWIQHIPKGIVSDLRAYKDIKFEKDGTIAIDIFFDALDFSHLKEILEYSNNFQFGSPFLGELPKGKFSFFMNELNLYRRKIAHGKASYDENEFFLTLEYVKQLCQGSKSKPILDYVNKESYMDAKEIPADFFEEYDTLNNLPYENYDLDGGFIGRKNELKEIKELLDSNEDRIITITGAGGVGKTAIALNIAYAFLDDPKKPFQAVLWFSAKSSKLTEDGIIPVPSQITKDDQLIMDILKILDSDAVKLFEESKVPIQHYKEKIYHIFKETPCLLVIDNLETILTNDAIISFIKNVPRDSRVLITSRKGLGEIERRYELKDMDEKDAIQLFRVVARQKKMNDLVKLPNDSIKDLVKRVKCYPLLIKWSIGQIYLGKDVNAAFSQITKGDSDIAKFSFNDVFDLLSDNAKLVLFSMVVIGDTSVPKTALVLVTGFDDDEKIDDAIKELIHSSFMYTITTQKDNSLVTDYAMLALTRGYVESKLDDDKITRNQLSQRHHKVSAQLDEYERTRSYFEQQQWSMGMKTFEEKLAYDYVKKAKLLESKGEPAESEKLYEKAINVAPKHSYAFIEFSKFQYSRKHYSKAIALSRQAVDVDPNNYHAWINYGIILRHDLKYSDSLICFDKALALIPNLLSIYTEKAITKIFSANYEEAEQDLLTALTPEDPPNNYQIQRAYKFLSECYLSWADYHNTRNDFKGKLEKLHLAEKAIQDALQIESKLKNLDLQYYKVNRALGLALFQANDFTGGRQYLERCLQTKKIGFRVYSPTEGIVVEACYLLAVYSFNEPTKEYGRIQRYIEQGLSICYKDSRYYEKFVELKSRLESEMSTSVMEDREYGFVRWFDTWDKYGIIGSGKESYFFILSNFKEKIPTQLLNDLVGKNVSFISTPNPRKENSLMAIDIRLEENITPIKKG